MMTKMTISLSLLAICFAMAYSNPVDQDGYNMERGYEVDPSREELLSYLASLDPAELRDLVQLASYYGGMKQKRWGRWGNKYADNKSYGFWITALNKAGNYKRGKRGAPFVPAMSAAQPPVSVVDVFSGDKKEVKELIPDHDYTQEQN